MGLSRAKSRKDTTTGLWLKCDGCSAMLYRSKVEERLDTCPECGEHFRIGGWRRVEITVDPDSFEEFGHEELRRSGLDVYTVANELTRNIVRDLGVSHASVPRAFPLGVANALSVPLIGSGHWGTQYDVSRDGQIVYFIDRTPAPRPSAIDVVIGWRALLK